MLHAAFSLSRVVQCLLNEDVTKFLDIFISVVCTPLSSVSTHIFVSWSSFTRSNSEIWGIAIILFIANDTYLYPAESITCYMWIEPFMITSSLQKGIRTISRFHASQSSEVAWYRPSAMRAYSGAASWTNCKNLVTPSTFMPWHILVKEVLQ